MYQTFDIDQVWVVTLVVRRQQLLHLILAEGFQLCELLLCHDELLLVHDFVAANVAAIDVNQEMVDVLDP